MVKEHYSYVSWAIRNDMAAAANVDVLESSSHNLTL